MLSFGSQTLRIEHHVFHCTFDKLIGPTGSGWQQLSDKVICLCETSLELSLLILSSCICGEWEPSEQKSSCDPVQSVAECLVVRSYRGPDKSLARPGRK